MPQDASQANDGQMQATGDIAVAGGDNAFAMVNSGGNTEINQSRHIIYNYYYYREASYPEPAGSATLAEELPCPYRGLFHFGPENAEFFFGRDVFVKELVQAVQTHAFIPVLGASGSGKSSVVFAGLVPQLQHLGHWQFTHFRPGEDPFYALALALVPLYQPGQDATDQIIQSRRLANALRNGDVSLADVIAKIRLHYPDDRVLLIADQFEELYTLCPKETIRQQFLDCLLASLAVPGVATSPLVLVATMRADFLGNALSYRPFADVLRTGDVKLGAMNQEELQAVIEKPAAKQGVTFESGLVQRILQDVESEPGNLPLLEFALTELWQRRQGRQLTHTAYTEIGGVQGALARHADESYSTFNPAEQALACQVLMRLVHLGQEQEVTRQRASWEQLWALSDAPEQVKGLVQRLASKRLVVTDEKAVEVAHEALLTQWPLFQQLIQENRQSIRLRNQLTNDCQEWQEEQRSKDYLLSPGRLAVFEEWIKRDRPKLSLLEAAYLQQSREERDRELRFYRFATVGAVSAALFISIVSIFGTLQWRTADREQIRAQTNFAKASFTVNRDTFDALLEALKAGKQLQKSFWFHNDPGLRSEVLGVLAETTNWVREYNRLEGHKNFVWAVSFSPDGQTLATGGWDNTLRLWNAEGKEIEALKDHAGAVTGISFSQDGKFLATCSKDGMINIRNARTGQILHSLGGGKDPLWRVRFSADGKTVAAVSEGGYITLWDWQSNSPGKVWRGHTGTAYDIDFSPDGKTIATAGDEGIIKLWNQQGELQGSPLSGHQGAVTTLRFNPVGTLLASGSKDNTVILWNWQTHRKQRILRGHSRGLSDIQFSPDGQHLATSGDDTLIFLWNRNGDLITNLEGHQERVTNLSFSPDGERLASASVDGSVKLWHLQPRIRVLKGYTDAVYIVSIKQPDGQFFATDGENNSVKLWNLDGILESEWQESAPVYSIDFSPKTNMIAVTNDKHINLRNLKGELISQSIVQHNAPILSVNFSPDAQIIATSSADGLAKLWNLSGQVRGELKGHTNAVHSIQFSPDGQTIATSSWDGTVGLWNSQGKFKRFLKVSDSQVYKVGFSPDSKIIASVSEHPLVKLWKLDGTPLAPLEGHTKAVMGVSFSPNGQLIATGSNDGTIKIWSRDSKLIMTLLRQERPINALSFTPDNQWLIAASADKVVLLIDMSDLTLQGLIQRGCHQVQNYRMADQVCKSQ